MHYEKYESNKMPYIIYLPFKLLQQSVFGIIHALWDILWTFEKYRDTDVDYQTDRLWYCSLNDRSSTAVLGENIKRTTDACNVHTQIKGNYVYLRCICIISPLICHDTE